MPAEEESPKPKQPKGIRRASARLAAPVVLSLACFVLAQGAFQGASSHSSQNAQPKALPKNTILVKGAAPSATDSVTPVPESGTLADSLYSSKYFRLQYALPSGWSQVYSGPPPSDTGYYVLAQLRPGDASAEKDRATLLITAQDLFFTLKPASNALALINSTTNTLRAEYELERPPTAVTVAHHPFVRFDYYSPVAQLHWYVLSTEVRCHMIQFVFTGSDSELLETLIHETDKMKLPAETNPTTGTGGNDVPVCIQNYARGDNVIERVDPLLTDRRFNPIPVRIVIAKDGKVKHIHFLSAFPDQARSITEALQQWRFKRYLQDGRPTEVETGIMFGHSPRTQTP